MCNSLNNISIGADTLLSLERSYRYTKNERKKQKKIIAHYINRL